MAGVRLMQTKDLTIEYAVTFKSNRGNFNHQPITTLVNNTGLTGDDFISLYRIRRSPFALSADDAIGHQVAIGVPQPSESLTGSAISADGRIGVSIGSSQGVTSLTGVTRIKAQSLTAFGPGNIVNESATETRLSTTSTTWRPEYGITIDQSGTTGIEVITFEKTQSLYTRDISISGLPTMADINVVGNGIRPLGRQAADDPTPDGSLGKAEILTYLYNRMETYKDWNSNGLTAVFDRSFNTLSGDLIGKAAGHGTIQTGGNPAAGALTVTGWSMGPIEGGFRLDGGGYIKTNRLSLKKSLFNARHHSTTGMTFMTYARFHASADQHIITLAGDETNPAFELIYRNGYDEKSWQGGSTRSPTGLIEFNNYLSSVTAGSITGAINSDGDLVPNTMGAPYPIELNKWYHIAATISATGSKSGMTIYINGENAVLMGSESSISAAAPAAATGNVVAMASPTNPYAAFGSAKQGNGATGSPIDIGLTRIFTRPLSHSEVFQNYIATIPGNVVLDTIKIG